MLFVEPEEPGLIHHSHNNPIETPQEQNTHSHTHIAENKRFGFV